MVLTKKYFSMAFTLLFACFFILPSPLLAQTVGTGPRHALVIGNGSYVELGKLKNPANDAADMTATLEALGFTVEKIIDADLPSMEDAVIRLGTRLAAKADSVGFFFYAGHGVQSEGTNYLIPADARIGSEAFLKTKALAVQAVLDILGGARNALNVIVLDACRDNPFSWSRSGTRGLSIVGSQPPGSIIAYATSAGSVAQDGTGRNGIFTQELLKQIRMPNLELGEVFKRTGAAVQTVTENRQIPAIYNQFFGNAFLAGASSAQNQMPVSQTLEVPKIPSLVVTKSYGSASIEVLTRGELYLGGKLVGTLEPGHKAELKNIESGLTEIEMRYPGGNRESKGVDIRGDALVTVSFSYMERPPVPDHMVYIQGGTFMMGAPEAEAGREDNEIQHLVTVSDFLMGKYEVTQGEWDSVMGSINPSKWKGSKLPVEQANWYQVIEYCNARSLKEGLSPCYTLDKSKMDPNNRYSEDTIKWIVSCDFSKNGYRLPTEAEWEYACRAGTTTATAFGNSLSSDRANFNGTKPYGGAASGVYLKKTKEVGSYEPNRWGLYDMHGNVMEWCWDWYGTYGKGDPKNPEGIKDPKGVSASMTRIARGGSWNDDGGYLRSANRDNFYPNTKGDLVGLRLVRSIY